MGNDADGFGVVVEVEGLSYGSHVDRLRGRHWKLKGKLRGEVRAS